MDEARRAMMSAISLRLMEVLNHVGLSEDVRWKRRQLAVETEITKTLAFQERNESIYIFGSQAEGSTIPGMASDIDFLKCVDDTSIIQTMEEWRPGQETYLMLQEEWTKPGYVKLGRCDKSVPQLLVGYHGDEFVYDVYEKCLLPRKPASHEDSHNGPASTFNPKGGITIDSVTAYRCHSWPLQAQEWFHRRRPYNWPSQSMISDIENNGCFLVPVGHPFSEERELEWKISFSLSERQLIWNLNEVQFKCYVLLKLIVKTFFKPYMEDSLCSYHCKMCILHVAENTEARLWIPENLLAGLSQCLQHLLMWLKGGNLPHYFMPDHNLFEHKVHGKVRCQAYSILQELISEDFAFLQRIDCDNIGQLLCASCNSPIVHMMRFTISEAIYDKIGWMGSFAALRVVAFHLSHIRQLISAKTEISKFQLLRASIIELHCLSLSDNVLIMDASRSLLPILFGSLGFHKLSTCLLRSIEDICMLKMSLKLLTAESVSELLSSKLKLTSAYCMTGNYHEANMLLEESIAQEEKCVICACTCTGIPFYHDLNRIGHSVMDFDCSLEKLIGTLTSTCVIYPPDQIRITPKALQYEMFRSVGDEEARDEDFYFWYDCAVIDAPIYCYFLQYLLHAYFKRTVEKHNAIRNMIARIGRRINLGHIETALNILGQCLKFEQMEHAALKCFRLSMLYKAKVNRRRAKKQCSPNHHNAAKWHIAIMLNNWFKQK